MSHIILKYPYFYKKVVSELYKSSRESYFLPTENRKYRLFLGRVSERTVCDPFFKHATVGYVVTWLRSFTNGSCSVTMQPCLVNWLQLRLRPVTKVSYRNQVSYRNRMGLRGNGN